MTKNDSIYFKDILEYINKAESFIQGMEYKDFATDEKTSLAVARCLEIIGEAAKHIPENTRQKYPGIPWKLVTGMRDVLIHAYSSVNLNKVWRTIKEDFPEIKPVIQIILQELTE